MNELANRGADGWVKNFAGSKLNLILAEFCVNTKIIKMRYLYQVKCITFGSSNAYLYTVFRAPTGRMITINEYINRANRYF